MSSSENTRFRSNTLYLDIHVRLLHAMYLDNESATRIQFMLAKNPVKLGVNIYIKVDVRRLD